MRKEKWEKKDRQRAKARKWKPSSGRSVFLALEILKNKANKAKKESK